MFIQLNILFIFEYGIISMHLNFFNQLCFFPLLSTFNLHRNSYYRLFHTFISFWLLAKCQLLFLFKLRQPERDVIVFGLYGNENYS